MGHSGTKRMSAAESKSPLNWMHAKCPRMHSKCPCLEMPNVPGCISNVPDHECQMSLGACQMSLFFPNVPGPAKAPRLTQSYQIDTVVAPGPNGPLQGATSAEEPPSIPQGSQCFGRSWDKREFQKLPQMSHPLPKFPCLP